MTPAIGQLPMKPMTMSRFFFIARQSNVELLCNYCGISSDDDIGRHAFCDDGAGGDDGIFADRHAFENDGVHADPDVVGNDDGRGADFRTRRAVLKERGESVRVDDPLSRRERMKIGISNADVPGNKTVRSDLDSFFGHDERAIEEGKIADGAFNVYSYRKGAGAIDPDVIV